MRAGARDESRRTRRRCRTSSSTSCSRAPSPAAAARSPRPSRRSVASERDTAHEHTVSTPGCPSGRRPSASSCSATSSPHQRSMPTTWSPNARSSSRSCTSPEDEGDDRVMSLAHEALWGDHLLGREVLGTLETIDGMDRDSIAVRRTPLPPRQPGAGGRWSHRPPGGGGRGERFLERAGGDRPVRTAPDGLVPVQDRALLRRPRSRPTSAWCGRGGRIRRRSLRPGRLQPDPGRRAGQPAVPGDP